MGGHIELNEDPNQAAVREVKEEVGLDIKLAGMTTPFKLKDYTELIPPKFLYRSPINDTHEHVTMVYFATSESNQTTESDDEKSNGLHWFTNGELDDPKWEVKDDIKHYAKAALQELGTKQ